MTPEEKKALEEFEAAQPMEAAVAAAEEAPGGAAPPPRAGAALGPRGGKAAAGAPGLPPANANVSTCARSHCLADPPDRPQCDRTL